MLKKLILRSVKVLWGFLATGVLLLAILVSILKYALPLVEDYKADIESYLLTKFGAQVSIAKLSATWQTTGPILVVDELKLTPSKSAPLDIEIKQTRIEIDFWRSLSQQKLVTEAFLLNGIQAQVNSEVFLKVRPNSQGNQLFESLSHVFLSQVNSFKVIDSNIIVNHATGRSQSYQIDNLMWVNQGNRHQGQGEVFVDGFSTNSLAVVVDLYGQRREDIFGQIYAEASQMDVSPWLTQVLGDHVTLTKSNANFKVWGDVQGGLVNNLLMDVFDTGVDWVYKDIDKLLRIDSARVHWRKFDKKWALFSHNVQLKTDSSLHAPFKFDLSGGGNNTQLTVQNIELSSLSPLFSLFSATAQLESIATSSAGGLLRNAQLQWSADAPLAAYVDLQNVSFQPQVQPNEPYLGINGLSVKGYWYDQQGWLDITGKNGQLLTNDTFSKPIRYKDLSIASHIELSELGNVIRIPKLSLVNDDVEIKLATEISLYEQTHLDLYVEVKGPSQGSINQYLPRHLLSKDVYQYLDGAIQQGRGEVTQVVLSGDPSYMPYSDLNKSSEYGVFWVNAGIRDALFKFDSQWPAIEHMDANLQVHNSLMTISAKAGQFAKLTLNHDVEAILALDQKEIELGLLLQPKQVEFQAFHDLVENTPLSSVLGDIFDFVKLSGSGDVFVELLIPISDDQADVTVKGQVVTTQAGMALPAINLEFTEVASEVEFENAMFSVDASAGKVFGLPVKFDVEGEPEGSNYAIDANINGTWQHKEIENLYPMALMNYFKGSLYNNLDVKVNIEPDAYQYYVTGKADLTNVDYKLSGPLVKLSGQPQHVNIAVMGDQDSNAIEVSIDKLISFDAVIPNQSARIEQAHLGIGLDNKGLPDSGFDIGINVSHLEFEPTLSFVLDILDALPEGETEGPGIIDSPSFVGGNIKSFNILGQEWTNVSLDAKPVIDHWLFSVGAKQTLTDVKVFNDITKRGIDIHSSFLQLSLEDKSSDQELVEDNKEQSDTPPDFNSFNSEKLISSLPPLKLQCDQCTLDGKPLGKVNIAAHTVDKKLLIDELTMIYERNSAAFKGSWNSNQGTGHTYLKGDVNSRYFGDWLLEYGLNSGIKESNADIALAVNWQGAPHQFNFATLNGNSTFKLGEGSLSEVSDQGARIFSLFSLDSLYRKLKFDFRDVFSKGLFYNEITGSAEFENGVVESNDIKMDGIAGDMTMEGITDLNQSVLDYNVSFKPKVTSSLGVLSWLAASNPVTIIGAFALDKIIEEADVVSEIKLKISGDLKDPKVEEVKRFTKRVKLPQAVKEQESVKPDREQPKPESDNGSPLN